MKLINLNQSEHYYFYLDKKIKVSSDLFCAEAENKYLFYHDLFDIIPSTSHELNYIVQYTDGITSFGKAYSKCIICYVNRKILISPYLIPFVHEEVHAIISRYWGSLPKFWNEGIAEFALYSLIKRMYPSLSNSFLNDYHKLSNEFEFRDINSFLRDDLLWTLEDDAFIRINKITRYGYIAAAYLIKTIFEEQGVCFLKQLLDLISTNDLSTFKCFALQNHIYQKWIANIQSGQ